MSSIFSCSEAFLLRAFFGRCLRVRFVRLRFGDDFGGRGGRGGQRRGAEEASEDQDQCEEHGEELESFHSM